MSNSLMPRSSKRKWSISEKRHMVELTMRKGTSVQQVATQYDIHPPRLSGWRTLYRNGKLVDHSDPTNTLAKTFLPVNIIEPNDALPPPTNPIRLRIDLPCGASLQLEAKTFDLQAVAALFTLVRT